MRWPPPRSAGRPVALAHATATPRSLVLAGRVLACLENRIEPRSTPHVPVWCALQPRNQPQPENPRGLGSGKESPSHLSKHRPHLSGPLSAHAARPPMERGRAPQHWRTPLQPRAAWGRQARRAAPIESAADPFAGRMAGVRPRGQPLLVVLLPGCAAALSHRLALRALHLLILVHSGGTTALHCFANRRRW
jgi:hypothetical protein